MLRCAPHWHGAMRGKACTVQAHDRSGAVQQTKQKKRYTETEFATCRKQTRMSEKVKNTSKFIN
ncbi:hypothetical protein AWB82_02249 [Caballeronia glebae]|uniref:Uncharacterized protein n=1 Tax=Caballeronia glebae TaxID=1777143 RepID=A0A158AFQ0_9BURK|nr:hypothetical protein AWB82_02249 [Caballeronia glebae]